MIIVLIFILLVTLYFYGTRNHNYWLKKQIKYEKPLPFIGSTFKQSTEGVSFAGRYEKLYYRYPHEKYVGYFKGNRQALLLRDLELIKHVLITDFRYFHDKGLSTWTREPLLKNLFSADGDTWKLMRQKMTPAFSNIKLKAMFPLILEITARLSKAIDTLVIDTEEIDAKAIMVKYTTDFIGKCGFGIDSSCLEDESSEFFELGARIFKIKPRDAIVGVLKELAPKLFEPLQFLSPEITRKIISLTKQVSFRRNNMPSGRNDFMDMMLELKQKGKIIGESIVKFNPDQTPMAIEVDFDDELLAAQVFVFFAAGLESSSASSSFILHLLAYHPEIQDRCYKEVCDVLYKYDGKLCYDAVKEMKYLEMTFRESLRIRPSPGFIVRNCVKSYQFHGTNLTIDKGTEVMISTLGLHHDEKHFKNPRKFRPERFHPDNVAQIKKCSYMPFGAGPRACIGERMGIMVTLAGVATVLMKYKVAPSKNSIRDPKVDPSSYITDNIIGGLPLLFSRRYNNADVPWSAYGVPRSSRRLTQIKGDI